MESHPTMRVQFYLRDPFDPIDGLSLTFFDSEGRPNGVIVDSGNLAQHLLWQRIVDLASDHIERFTVQLNLLE